MLRKIENFVTLVVCLATVRFSSAQNQPYTASQLTTNNTAACSSSSYAPLSAEYCGGTFPGDGSGLSGWEDDQWVSSTQTLAPVITTFHDPSPAGQYDTQTMRWNNLWNISKGRGPTVTPNDPARTDVHSLMYGNGVGTLATTVIVELQNWFCDPNYGFNCGDESYYAPASQEPSAPYQNIGQYFSHDDVLYTVWNQDTMNERAVDMWDRGGDTVAMDWYGGPNDCPPSGDTDNFDIGQYSNACSQKFQLADTSYQEMLTAMQNLGTYRPGASLTFYLMLDQGAWHGARCADAGLNEPWCAANSMIADLHYALTGLNESGQGYNNNVPYFTQSNYMTVGGPDGSPVIAFFQDEYDDFSQCNTNQQPPNQCVYGESNGQPEYCSSQSDCFNQVYSAIQSWLNTQQSPLGLNNYYRIFAYQSGCPAVHMYSDGCYEWIKPHANVDTQGLGDPSQVTIANQMYDDGVSGEGKQAGDSFYQNSTGQTGANGKPAMIVGAAYKGFDDYMARWWTDRIISQECGQSWLYTWEEMTWDSQNNEYGGPDAPYNSTNKPLAYMLVETWDDYEEGTEVETGIDNCLEENTFTLSVGSDNSTLTWTFDFSQPQAQKFNPYNTIDHYALYYSTSGNPNQYFLKATIPNTTATCNFDINNQADTCSTDLNNYSWNCGTSCNLYVQAIGKPTIANHMSPLAVWTP